MQLSYTTAAVVSVCALLSLAVALSPFAFVERDYAIANVETFEGKIVELSPYFEGIAKDPYRLPIRGSLRSEGVLATIEFQDRQGRKQRSEEIWRLPSLEVYDVGDSMPVVQLLYRRKQGSLLKYWREVEYITAKYDESSAQSLSESDRWKLKRVIVAQRQHQDNVSYLRDYFTQNSREVIERHQSAYREQWKSENEAAIWNSPRECWRRVRERNRRKNSAKDTDR